MQLLFDERSEAQYNVFCEKAALLRRMTGLRSAHECQEVRPRPSPPAGPGPGDHPVESVSRFKILNGKWLVFGPHRRSVGKGRGFLPRVQRRLLLFPRRLLTSSPIATKTSFGSRSPGCQAERAERADVKIPSQVPLARSLPLSLTHSSPPTLLSISNTLPHDRLNGLNVYIFHTFSLFPEEITENPDSKVRPGGSISLFTYINPNLRAFI